MKKLDKLISVVVPFRNLGTRLEEFVRDCALVLEENYQEYEIILIDDGSIDSSLASVKQILPQVSNVRVISLSRSFGRSIAASAGLDTAIGDYVAILDPQSDSPALIPSLVSLCSEGNDIVFGVSTQRPRFSLLERVTVFTMAHYIKSALGIQIPKGITSLRCFSRTAINALTRLQAHHRFYHFVGSVIGFKSSEFKYQPINSITGTSLPSTEPTVDEYMAIVIENSPHPLRIFSAIGLTIAGFNFLYMGYVVLLFFIKKDVMEGWTTLSFQTSGLFLCVILMLTAMSEYIGRLLSGLRTWPNYIVREELNSPVMSADRRINVVNLREASSSGGSHGSRHR